MYEIYHMRVTKAFFKWFTYFWYWRQFSKINNFQWYSFNYCNSRSYYLRNSSLQSCPKTKIQEGTGVIKERLKTYITTNRKLISKELLDVIHEQNMKMNLSMIKKEAEIFGLLFLGDGDTISRCPLLNILTSAKKYQLLYWKLLIVRVI